MTATTTTTTEVEIPTFRQYVDNRRRLAAAKYGITLAEAARELPDSRYRSEWRELVVKLFEDGNADMPTRLWRSLDEGLRYRVLRTSRALRDDELTRHLRALLAR